MPEPQKSMHSRSNLKLVGFVAIALFCKAANAQTALVSQNFDDLPPQVVSNNSSSITLGSGAGTLILQTNAPGATIEIVDRGGGNKVARFTDNVIGENVPNMVSTVFGAVNASSPFIIGSFDYKALDVGDKAPTFMFGITGNSEVGFDNKSTSVQVRFENNGGSATRVAYFTNEAYVNNVASLTAGKSYRIHFVADYSQTGSTKKDTFFFYITDLTTSSIIYASPSINGRCPADTTPNRLVFYANQYGGGNPEPFCEIDNITFSSARSAP